MWYAAIGWQGDHYLALVQDGEGRPVIPQTVFAADRIDQVVALVRSLGSDSGCPVISVIDSVSGVLERHLVEAGLEVYRADPRLLAQRPADGSVSPTELAAVARADRSSLFRLTVSDGGLTGRDRELRSDRADGAKLQRALTADGRFLVRGDATTGREVALTFDDGPDPRFTPQVLEVLRRYGAAATFFCIGLNARGFPEMLERIAADGHEIGNHTWSHPYLPDLTAGELDAQLDRTNHAIETATGRLPTLFRPPYGGRNASVLERAADAGFTTVLWDVETLDWAFPGPAAIARDVIEQSTPGSVVLMHDGGGDRSQTVAALPAILDHLCGQGYQCVPVSRLL